MSSLLRTSFTDPGIIPRASHDEAAYIEKQIGECFLAYVLRDLCAIASVAQFALSLALNIFIGSQCFDMVPLISLAEHNCVDLKHFEPLTKNNNNKTLLSLYDGPQSYKIEPAIAYECIDLPAIIDVSNNVYIFL